MLSISYSPQFSSLPSKLFGSFTLHGKVPTSTWIKSSPSVSPSTNKNSLGSVPVPSTCSRPIQRWVISIRGRILSSNPSNTFSNSDSLAILAKVPRSLFAHDCFAVSKSAKSLTRKTVSVMCHRMMKIGTTHSSSSLILIIKVTFQRTMIDRCLKVREWQRSWRYYACDFVFIKLLLWSKSLKFVCFFLHDHQCKKQKNKEYSLSHGKHLDWKDFLDSI